jgi:PAS domain S-box-containing protein
MDFLCHVPKSFPYVLGGSGYLTAELPFVPNISQWMLVLSYTAIAVMCFYFFRHQRAVEALRKSELRLRSITQSANAAIISADQRGNIISWNGSAQAIFGYGENDVVGKPLTILIPEKYKARHEDGLRRLRMSGESNLIGKTVELDGRRSDGSEFPLELSLATWKTEEGTFYTGIVHDITARKEAEQEILRLNAAMKQWVSEVEEANRDLESFSYSISHDLRAPLRALDGYSRILLESHASALTEEVRHYLELIRKNAQEMAHLIDDLLNFSRLGRQPLRLQPVLPSDVARRALMDLRAEQEGRKVRITLAELPACRADPALLKQVYANLLGNALKYTRSRPEATIEIGFQPAPESGETVYFVRDNGVGFDMRYGHKLFGVFQRLHRSDEYEGTGVGLAIVKRIVQRHSGRIWAEASVDRGAAFFFTLKNGVSDV